MKEFLDITILSVLQGVAEFLPISSSGHLVIGQHFLGVNVPGLRLDTFLHVGTLASILIYYRKIVASIFLGVVKCEKESLFYLAKIFISALPAVVVYVVLGEKIEALFENAKIVGAFLVVTALVLVITRYLPKGENSSTFKNAFFMGLAQSIALLPGVSRSGMTLSASRLCKMSPEKAAEFSFLMSAPLIGGAALMHIAESFSTTAAQNEISWTLTIYGAVVAAVVGYFSLDLLVKTLKGKGFWMFGIYCFIAGLLTLCFC
jgi:undecaprenyl-diphosphatase